MLGVTPLMLGKNFCYAKISVWLTLESHAAIEKSSTKNFFVSQCRNRSSLQNRQWAANRQAIDDYLLFMAIS